MWYKKGNDRLSEWRKFRYLQKSLPLNEQLQNTVNLWKDCHLGHTHYDFLNIKDWPTPWELVLEDSFDDFSRALGMAFTLIMIDDWQNESLFLRCYKDSDRSTFYHTLELNDIILNFNLGEIINKNYFSKSAKLICEYNYIDLCSKSK